MAPPDWKRYSPDPTPDGEPTPEVRRSVRPAQPRRVRSLEERTVRPRGHGRLVAGVEVERHTW